MDIETIQTKMMEQLDQAQKSAMATELGWAFEVANLFLYVTLRPRKHPAATYLLRVEFSDFPQKAPSYIFVDESTKDMSDRAWPPKVRHGAQPPGVCTPGTREFHDNYHLNDKGYPWDHERFTVLDTLKRIHDIMERGVG